MYVHDLSSAMLFLSPPHDGSSDKSHSLQPKWTDRGGEGEGEGEGWGRDGKWGKEGGEKLGDGGNWRGGGRGE